MPVAMCEARRAKPEDHSNRQRAKRERAKLAEREGFEPPEPFRVQWFSRPPPSTTRPSLRPLGMLYRARFVLPRARFHPPRHGETRYCQPFDQSAVVRNDKSVLRARSLPRRRREVSTTKGPFWRLESRPHSRLLSSVQRYLRAQSINITANPDGYALARSCVA